MSLSSTQILFSKCHSPIKETRTPWRTGLLQGKHKQDKLEYLISEIEEVLKKTKNKLKKRAYQKGTGDTLKKLSRAKFRTA